MKTKEEVREQTQEDIISYFESNFGEWMLRQEVEKEICQIVVNNFKELEWNTLYMATT